MTFRPISCRSRWEGLLATSWIVLVDLALLIWIFRRPVDGVSFLMLLGVLISLPLLIWLGYRTWGAFNLLYWMDRDALYIRWASIQQVIPLHTIQQVLDGSKELGGRSLIHWPSPFVRSGTGLGILNLERFASRPLPECLLVETDSGITFAISPIGQNHFVDALHSYHRLGPLRPKRMERQSPAICATNPLANARSRWMLLGGLLGLLLLFGTLMIRYPALPERLIFHYDTFGQPDSIRPKQALFLLPFIGLLTYLVNGVGGLWMGCRRQQSGAYLLWGSTLLVQGLVFWALLTLMG